MTTSISTPLSFSTQWQILLSTDEEKNQIDNCSFWSTAQTITISAIAILGTAILISPYVLPISYATILSNAFAIVPLVLPIPGYFYSYFGSQAIRASNLAKKILFCRQECPQIESNSQFLEDALKETFGNALSAEKKELLHKTKNIQPAVLSLIAYLKSDIKNLEAETEKLRTSLSLYIEKDLTDLSNNALFSTWKELIIAARETWINNRNNQIAIDFLQNLKKIIQNSPSKDSEALLELSKIQYDWQAKVALPFSKKWEPVFNLEEKIVTTESRLLFLWTFLFRPEEDFMSLLEKHKLEIEYSLLDYSIKPKDLSLTDMAVGELYNEPSIKNVLTLPNNEIINREEFSTPEKRAIVLDKLLEAIAKAPEKKPQTFFRLFS